MGPLLLALSLGASPDLWVASEGFDSPACDSSALVSALRAQQPAGSVHLWHPGTTLAHPPAGAIFVRLVSRDGAAVLAITGAGEPITRTLPPVDDCKRDVDIAALIVDGALDDLRVSGSAPRVDSLAPPVPLRSLVQVGVALGGGVEQGPSGWVGSLDVQGVARYRFYELTLDVDLGVPSNISFANNPPEAGGGALSITSFAPEFGFGLAPRLGPGLASVDVLVGASVVFATTPTPTTADVLFRSTSQTLTNAFFGLRLGYSADLPRGFFVGARVEERLAPNAVTFLPDATRRLTTRNFTLQTLAFAGYRFL